MATCTGATPTSHLESVRPLGVGASLSQCLHMTTQNTSMTLPLPSNRELKELCARHGIDTSSALERADLIALAQPCLPTPPTPAPTVAAPEPSSAPGSAAAPALSSEPRPAPLLSTEPAAPSLHVRKAYRDVDGAFDGDTDDSDEEHAADGGFLPSKRPRPGIRSPSRGSHGVAPAHAQRR